jgi:hypothetical protein
VPPLFGTVKKIEEKSAKNEALLCFMDPKIKGRSEDIRGMNDGEYDSTLVLEVTIETASSKIRNVSVADELVDYDLDTWAGLMPLKQIAEYPIADKRKPENLKIPKHILDYYYQNK